MCYEAARRNVIAPSWAWAVTWCEIGVGLRQCKQKVGREPEVGKQELELKVAQGYLRGSWHLQGLAWSLGMEGSPGRLVGRGEPGLGWTTARGRWGSHVHSAWPMGCSLNLGLALAEA